jgi:hypothetical protein
MVLPFSGGWIVPPDAQGRQQRGGWRDGGLGARRAPPRRLGAHRGRIAIVGGCHWDFLGEAARASSLLRRHGRPVGRLAGDGHALDELGGPGGTGGALDPGRHRYQAVAELPVTKQAVDRAGELSVLEVVRR